MKDASVRRWSRFHTFLYRITGGQLGRRLVDNDMLLLTTRGHATGDTHTVPLLYLTDDDRYVVIASYGGRASHPDWYMNLVEYPIVEVMTPGSTKTMTARTAGPDERATWWPRVLEAYNGYGTYQSRTDRQIPVVFLEPISRPDN
jgi:deazaflavin-dependent oxidoreductase (nitroreductase family)